MFSHSRLRCRWLWGNGSSPAGQVEREAKEESLVSWVGSGRIKSRPGRLPGTRHGAAAKQPSKRARPNGADRLDSARPTVTRSTTGNRHSWMMSAVTAVDGVWEKALLSQGSCPRLMRTLLMVWRAPGWMDSMIARSARLQKLHICTDPSKALDRKAVPTGCGDPPSVRERDRDTRRVRLVRGRRLECIAEPVWQRSQEGRCPSSSALCPSNCFTAAGLALSPLSPPGVAG